MHLPCCTSASLLNLSVNHHELRKCSVAALVEAAKVRSRIAHQWTARTCVQWKPGERFTLGKTPSAISVEILVVQDNEYTATEVQVTCHGIIPLSYD